MERNTIMSLLEQSQDKRTRTFTAIIYWEEDVYVAECPEVGTASQGETIEEAIANLKEATELYLEEFPLPETASHRLLTTFEVMSA
jgi:predicted RNase H-like HicB family nuclease